MRWRRSPLPLLLIAGALLLGSCAAFRTSALQTGPWPPTGGGTKRSVKIIISGIDGQMLAGFYPQTIAAFHDSALFSKVLTSSQPERSDITAEMRVIHSGGYSRALAVLSGLTLTVIPSTAVDEFEVRTDFKDAMGNVLASTRKIGGVRAWIHITLVFLMPFFWPGSQSDAVVYDLSRASLIEAAASGAFK